MTDKVMTAQVHNKGQDKGQEKSKDNPVFSVNSIYVKDLSFEAPRTPYVFNEEWHPKLDFDLQMSSNKLDEKEDLYEAIIHLTVKVNLTEEQETKKDKEEKSAFLIEVQQAGVFTVHGFPEDVLKQILSTACPSVLYPYAREAISNLVQRGGFPQLILPPINFEAMYAQHLAQEESKGKAEEKGQGTKK